MHWAGNEEITPSPSARNTLQFCIGRGNVCESHLINTSEQNHTTKHFMFSALAFCLVIDHLEINASAY
jgi:hypothetical protein